MISAKLAGAIVLGLPLILIAWVLLRRQARAIFFFALALILVGLGYLMSTGATDDIARSALPGRILQPAR
jgi:dipeptide/tripeptide permease